METDHFTNYAQAYVTQSQTALTTAKALWDNFIIHYGLPEKILSELVSKFYSELVPDLCRLMRTKKLRTSLYHPQTNGQCERFNSTLIGMLGTLPHEHKSDWKGSIGALAHPYNCTQHSATGFSPLLPHVWKTTLGLTPNLVATPTSSKYIEKLRKCVRWDHKKADLFQQKEHGTTNRTMAGIARQWPWSRDTVLVHATTSRANIKYKTGGKTGNM